MIFETIFRKAQPAGPPPQPEKSQEELRAILKRRFQLYEPIVREKIDEYEQALKDNVFEDQEGEKTGAGEERKKVMQTVINGFFVQAETMRTRLDSKELLPQTTSEISATYTYTNPQTNKVERQETITLVIEAKLQEFLSFYQTTHVDLPLDFEDTMRDIWNRNYDDIQKAIEEEGFDGILIVPSTPDIGDLSEKMKMEQGYSDWIQTNANVQTLRGIPLQSKNTDKPRILLVHNTQNLQDRPELKKTLNIKGEDVKLDEVLTLEDYLIFQRIYFEETGKHLDEIGWTLLATKSGARLVASGWYPDARRLYVRAVDLGYRNGSLGARSSRCFF